MRACPPNLRRRVATALLSLVTLAGAGTLTAQAENPHEADLELTKTASATAVVGGSVIYTIKVGNHGSTTDPDQIDLPGTKVEIDDHAPVGVSFVSTEITHNSANGDRCTTTAQAVHCDIHGNIRPDGVDYVEVTVTGLVTEIPSTGRICNVASVTGNHPDRNQGNNKNSDTSACTTIGATPSRSADLDIKKDADKTVVRSGGTSTYTLTVTNKGPDAANTVVVRDALPEGMEFDAFVGTTSCTENEGVVSCSIAQLAKEATFVVSYKVKLTADSGSAVCNHASVLSNDLAETDPVSSNNVASVCVTVKPQADLSVSKTASPIVALIGEDVVYTIQVHNAGPNAATNVVVNDNVPAQANVKSASSVCSVSPKTASGTPVMCTLGTIGSGDNVTVTITVTVNAKGMVENTATVSSSADQDDLDSTDRTSSVTTPYVSLTGSGAFGEFIDVKTILGLQVQSGPLASVMLPAGGGGPISASAANVYVTGGFLLKDLVRLDALTGTTQGGKTASGKVYVKSLADVAKVSLVNGLVTVEKLHSECYADSAPSGTGSSNIVKLRVLGAEVKFAAGPNSKVVVPGVGELILNEQVNDFQGPFLQTRTVNALHLKLYGPLAYGDVILAQAKCRIDP